MKYWITVEEESGVVLRFTCDVEVTYRLVLGVIVERYRYDDIYHGDDGDC